MIKNVRIALILFLLSYQSFIVSGFAEGTKICTPTGLRVIEDLMIGDMICSYDTNSNEFLSVPIKDISWYILRDFLCIEIDQVIIKLSHDQIFYDDAQRKFVPATETNRFSQFVAKDGQQYRVILRNQKNLLTKFYDISLDEPHVFFVSEKQVMVHNFVPAVALYPITEWVLGNVIIIACAYFNQSHKLFPDFDQAQKQVHQETIAYAYRYNELVNLGISPHAPINISFNPNPSLIMGIRPNPEMYHYMKQYPFLCGPICATAQMRMDGDIVVILYFYGFDHEDDQNRIFSWKELGRETVRRDHDLVRFFIDIEDKKQLDEIRNILRTWPYDIVVKFFASPIRIDKEANLLRFSYGLSKQSIYENIFDIYALYHMAEKNIPPSLALQTIKYGSYKVVGKFLLFSDSRYNVSILLDSSSGDIVDVGYYGTNFELLKLTDTTAKDEAEEDDVEDELDEDDEEESEIKTVEDILEGAEPGKESDKTEQYTKPGGFDAANEDFDAMQPTDVQDKGDGIRVGDLPGGKTVVVRPTSSNSQGDGNFPTLEIRDKNKQEKTIKIRYTNE